MAKYSISCKDMGLNDCDLEVRSASSEGELFEILKTFARMSHNMQGIHPDKVQAAKKAMKIH